MASQHVTRSGGNFYPLLVKTTPQQFNEIINPMSKTTIATLITSALLAFPAEAQNLIRNGSFESPAITVNSFKDVTPTSWSWSGTYGFIHNGNSGNPSLWPLPQNGQQFGNVGNESFFMLSQPFIITNQAVYALSWYDSTGHSDALTTSPYSALVLTGAVQSLMSNRFDAYHSTFGVWVARSQQLVLNPGVYTLRFQAEGVFSGLDALIDNVSLERLPYDDLLPAIHISAVDICWAGRTNQVYQVQYRTSLSGTNWFNFGPPLIGTGTNCVTDGVNAVEQRFYRVTRAP